MHPPSTKSKVTIEPLEHDALVPHLSEETPLGRRIKAEIQREGYVVIRNVLTPEECDVELSRLWDFVEATSPGVCRDEPNSWYPNPKEASISSSSSISHDPWPHSGWAFLPDMCQSYQAGWLFSSLREKLADRIFAPLYGTHQLHSSKEGFTFHRPTDPRVTSNGALHPFLNRDRPRVCGKVQSKARGEHFDQCASHTGLQCIQSSTALIDQDVDGGCFLCWPRSHGEHARITADIWRGRSDWVPLTDDELNDLEALGMTPCKVPVNAGDVILWRSDLVHCGVGPSVPREGFRAVSYTAMLPASMTPSDVLENKFVEYLNMETGDHRPNVRSRHFALPNQEKKLHGSKRRTGQINNDNGTTKDSDSSNVEPHVQRGKYFADGPPVLTLRQAELYGLIPYNRTNNDHEILKGKYGPYGQSTAILNTIPSNMVGKTVL